MANPLANQRLIPDIVELSGNSVDTLLFDLPVWETHAAAAVATCRGLWIAHTYLKAGTPSAALSDPRLRTQDTTEARFLASAPAAAFGIRLRDFAAHAFAMVESALRARLDSVFAALAARPGGDARGKVRFHAILTITRTPAGANVPERQSDSCRLV